MPPESILETLVKLAAAGTSGVCILALASCAFIVVKVPESASPTRHQTIRLFMGISLVVALVSAGTTALAGYWDYKGKLALRSENRALATRTEEQAVVIEEKEAIAATLRADLTRSSRAIAQLEESTQRLALARDTALSRANLLESKVQELAREDPHVAQRIREFQLPPSVMALPPQD